MKVIKWCFVLLIVPMIIISCQREAKQSSSSSDEVRIAFYNVENLFDTQDDRSINDEEFLPTSKKKWNEKRYNDKINAIAKVIIALGSGQGPELIGLCEVENESVLADLVSSKLLAPQKYGFVHYDSPDRRGIDVALLYKKEFFEVKNSEKHKIIFPFQPNSRTRDILRVTGTFNNGQDELHVFINHFPSRREGMKKSEPRRLYVASEVRSQIEKIMIKNADANIVVMGDFNDEPFNKSIRDVIRAKQSKNETKKDEFFNTMAPLEKAGQGSYNFRGDWNMMDQVMVSASMLDDSGFKFKDGSATVFKESWLLQGRDAGKYEGNPDRTYAGNRYLGGVSDHLPVYIDLVKQE